MDLEEDPPSTAHSLSLEHWFSTEAGGDSLLPPRPPPGIWQRLETYLVVTTGRGKGVLLAFSVQSLDLLLNVLQCTGQPP